MQGQPGNAGVAWQQTFSGIDAAFREDADQLPNPVPLSWSPVRSYLGARNAVRFIKKHANREQKRFFWRSTLGAVPLEYFAAVMGREEEFEMGKWTRRRIVTFFFLRRHGIDFARATTLTSKSRMAIALLAHLPVDLFWTLPRLVWTAHREGHVTLLRVNARGRSPETSTRTRGTRLTRREHGTCGP